MAGERDVVLVRHGQTAWSATGRHTGRTDVPLTDEGRRQGEEVGALLAPWSFATVLTSPLGRARETCRAAGFEGEVDPDLQEWDYGDHEGRTTPEIRADDRGWTVWRGPVPGGESIDDVAVRADRVIARIVGVEGDIAVFSHGHFLRVLAARWLRLPPTAGGMLLLDTGTISVLSTERESPAIRLWNGVPPTTT